MLKGIPVIIDKMIIIIRVTQENIAFGKNETELTLGTGSPASRGSRNASTSRVHNSGYGHAYTAGWWWSVYHQLLWPVF